MYIYFLYLPNFRTQEVTVIPKFDELFFHYKFYNYKTKTKMFAHLHVLINGEEQVRKVIIEEMNILVYIR